MTFYVPGSKHYDNALYTNRRSFANISITGTHCDCHCEHCNGSLLRSMLQAPEPKLLTEVGRRLVREGCQGVLISGGACLDGSVPLVSFLPAIKQLATMGLAVIVHPGIVTEPIATGLAAAGVEAIALDLIGDQETIKTVYHLDREPADYRQSLRLARASGLKVTPHIVVGLNYGKICGEYAALQMVAEEGADSLVLVIIKPIPGTGMAGIKPPAMADVEDLFQTARGLLPTMPLRLGCARPAGKYALAAERAAVDAGFNSIAFPASQTIEYVIKQGLGIRFRETCCGL